MKFNIRMTYILKKLLSRMGLLTLVACLGALASSCGKEEFLNQNYSTATSPQGYLTIPAKVDILLVVDNTPSFEYPVQAFKNSLPTFVSNLASQGWDYHIAAIPMAPGNTASYVAPSITNVLVDASRNTPMIPDFNIPNSGYVGPSAAITNNYSLQTVFQTNYYIGSNEQTFRGIRDALSSQSVNFLRPDALLVVVIVSNGEDVSGSSVSAWATSIMSAAGKSSTQQVKLYPIVSQSYTSQQNCWNANALQGARYMSMGYYFGVDSYSSSLNFCNHNMNDLVSALSQQLTINKVAVVTSAIVLSKEPILKDVKIYKNGDLLPQSQSNGWWYVGYSSTAVPTITQPFPADYRSGWVIQLNGSAQARGNDTLKIDAAYK